MTKWIGTWLMVLRLESAMVGNDLYGHMCVFLAGGLRTSEGIVYLSITLRMRSCLRPWGGSDAGREEEKGLGLQP